MKVIIIVFYYSIIVCASAAALTNRPLIDLNVIDCIQDQLESIRDIHPQFSNTIAQLNQNFDALTSSCHRRVQVSCEIETRTELQFNVIRYQIKNAAPNAIKYWDEIVAAIEYCVNSNLRKNTGIPNYSFYV